MPSPFPGMDPYVEAPEGWLDFHNDLAAEIRAALNREIQPRYFAQLSAYVTYEVIEVGRSQGILPDIGVARVEPPRGEIRGGVAMMAPAPVRSSVPLEITINLDRVEIRATVTGLLVTLI